MSVESRPKRSLRGRIALRLLGAMGWAPEGGRPEPTRCVLIAAPHTTNWDFLYLLLFAACFELDIRWMGKHALFRPPLGWLMRALGGIPIVRHRSENVVAAMVRAFDQREKLVLVVPAEGTRHRADYWRSGFYHIARNARVPIVMAYLDYATRRGGFGPTLLPTGDLASDMDHVRVFYSGKTGRHPMRFSRVRLRKEGGGERDGRTEGGREEGARPVVRGNSLPSAKVLASLVEPAEEE